MHPATSAQEDQSIGDVRLVERICAAKVTDAARMERRQARQEQCRTPCSAPSCTASFWLKQPLSSQALLRIASGANGRVSAPVAAENGTGKPEVIQSLKGSLGLALYSKARSGHASSPVLVSA